MKFFTCAWSTFVEEFKDNLTCPGSLKKELAKDAVTYNVKYWVRAYFTSRCKSWVVDNNMSGSFNSWIDECRFLPVIRMCDGIRLKMMAKWVESETQVCCWNSDFSPKCMDLFESSRYLAIDCRVFFNGDDRYEVVEGQDRHLVNVSHYYHKDTYIASYRTKLQPIRGKKFWDTISSHYNLHQLLTYVGDLIRKGLELRKQRDGGKIQHLATKEVSQLHLICLNKLDLKD
ncbi:hypothetical protein QN277_018795 [Acacia crassicarpa]|uniref:Uncharacterized protein n=1 Tax=Acacia crassicarpa TaxID=499986 RepID=A0AAE1JSH2_9FABA|nr:hypothetical protein QN277_018795 [Acacia crassicarpa]